MITLLTIYYLYIQSLTKKDFQRGFVKLSKNSLSGYLIISILIVSTGLIYLFNPFTTKSADAAWFNDNWGYRKSIPVGTHSAAENNVYIEFTVDTAALTTDKLQADCDDLRFTKNDGKILPYQIVSGCDTDTTTLRVGFDSMPAAPFYFYIYYGNPSAGAGSTTLTQAACSNTCTAGTLASEEKAPSPVAYWKFDDGTGTTAQDSTVNNNDGTISGATWQTEDQCIAGKCLFFDGTDDRVTTSNAVQYNASSTGNVTIGAWVKTTNTGATQTIFSTYDTTGPFFIFQISSANVAYFQLRGDSGNPDEVTGTRTVADNRWHFIQAVRDNSNSKIRIYVDGTEDNSAADTNTHNLAITTSGVSSNPKIGANQQSDGSHTYNHFLKGFIDEPKIFNYARSAAQIKADYDSRSNPEGAAAVLGTQGNNNPQALANGLVGYWKMDESSGNATDSSGNSLTLTNNGTTTYVAGKFGNGSEHVPASSQYLSTATTISGVKTVSFWVNPDSTTNYYISLTSSAYITSSSGTLSATGFTSPTIYVNGAQTTTIAADSWQLVTVTSDTAINADTFYVGRQGSNYFDGTMDEARVYNKALSSAEVSQLYNFAPGPVGYWKMDENTGTSAYDSSGNANTGTLTSGPTWKPGKYGGSVNFDGTDDYVSIGDPSSGILDFGTGSFSVGAWAKTSITSGIVSVVEKKLTTGTNAGYEIWVGDTNAAFKVSDASTPTQVTATTNTADGNWHYYMGTRDSSGAIKFYVDGVLAASGTGATQNVSNAISFNIGATGTPGNYLTGQVDDVKVYNYTRSPDQIVSDMNAGHPNVGSPVGSALGHWRFDEGALNTCSGGTNDACNSGSQGSTLDGTFNGNASYTQSGKFGRALALDGSGDYANIADNSALEGMAQLTVSAWIKPNSGLSDYNYVLTKQASATTNLGGYEIYMPPTGTICAIFDINSTVKSVCTSGTNYFDASWHYVSATYDGSTMRLYIDGNQKNSTSASGSIGTSAVPLTIGIRNDLSYGFTGSIDEVKIYNYALTADQVKLDMNQGKAQVLGAISDNSSYQKQAANQEYCIPGDSTSCAAPVGRWDFSENTGSTANDTSGNGNTGTWNGTLGSQWKPGKVGPGGNFNGTNNYVSVTDVDSLEGMSAITISMWVYQSQLGSYRLIQKNSAAGYMISNWSDGNLYFDVNGTTSRAITGNVIPLNQWYHVVAVSTGTTLKIYVNGKEEASSSKTTAVPSDTANLEIGRSAEFHTGKIDQVRIFNYARSAAQVAWDYNKGAPVGHWKMDECQGSVANDSSGNSNTGALTAASTIGTCNTSSTFWGSNSGSGKFNYAPTWAANDVIRATETTSTDLGATTDSYTTSAWIKTTNNFSGSGFVLVKHDGSGAYPYALYVNSSEYACFQISDNTNSPSACGSTALNDGNWHLLTGVRDVTADKVYIYVDGIAITNSTDSTTATTVNNDDVSIGNGDTSYVGADFIGQIDDVKVFNYALTAGQIKQLYNENFSTRYGPSSGAP